MKLTSTLLLQTRGRQASPLAPRGATSQLTAMEHLASSWLAAMPSPSSTVGATPSPTLTPASTPSPSGSPAAQAVNFSTRMMVLTGDRVGIGGFIVTGTGPKNVIVRALGPSLTRFGITDPLA